MSIERGPSPEQMGIKQETAESEQLQNLKKGLESMKGPEMRKILDKEYELI